MIQGLTALTVATCTAPSLPTPSALIRDIPPQAIAKAKPTAKPISLCKLPAAPPPQETTTTILRVPSLPPIGRKPKCR
ncbi:MAG: hypothetical protein KME13_16185 [Myxacorys californica WJT36-NPBG1]|nr:hypothetical protein [Myxacorys californica WJT36-NPBG1]